METICITALISDFPENVVPGMATQHEGRAYKLLLAMTRGTKTPLTLAEFIPEYALKLRVPKASVTSTREKKPTKYRTCNDDADDTQQTDYENFDYSENDEGGDDFIEEDIEDEVEEDSSRRFTFHGKEELRAVMGEGIYVSTPIM